MINKISKLVSGIFTLSSLSFASNAITFEGNPLTLEGTKVIVGQQAPNFKLTKNDLTDLNLSDFKGKNVLVSTIVSIDTPVCDIQTKKFNEEAAKLKDTVVLTVSTDLPFALARYCADKGITSAVTASDYSTRKFSKDYGLFIKELSLSTRAIIIIDKNGYIAYTEYLKEITDEPNYEAALKALDNIK